jgi:hypothetical protein
VLNIRQKNAVQVWDSLFTVVPWSCLELQLFVLREVLMQEERQPLYKKRRLNITLSRFVT